jgi:hypothetical protein
MSNLVRQYECWIDNKQKVLSFHFVSKFMHKKFENYVSFINYVIWQSQSGFKIQ